MVLWLPALHAAAHRSHGGPHRLRGLPGLPGRRGGPGGCQGPDGALCGGGERAPGMRPDLAAGRRRPKREPAPPQHATVPRGQSGTTGHSAGAH